MNTKSGPLFRAIATSALLAVGFSVPATSQTCDANQILVTTTPAPPTYAAAWALYQQQLAKATPQSVDLVIVGDSLVQGWSNANWSNLRVFNLGITADRTQNVLWRLEAPEWANLKPKKVVVLLGTNNLPSDPACAVVDGLRAVFRRVHQLWPQATVIFLGIPPRGDLSPAKEAERQAINTSFSATNSFQTLDIDSVVNDGGGFPLYREDKIHLLPPAYRALTAYLMPKLQ